MLGGLGVPELIIILVIVMLVFGVGRVGEIGKDLGKGIREFRKASSGDFDEDPKPAQNPAAPAEAPEPVTVPAASTDASVADAQQPIAEVTQTADEGKQG